MEYPKYLLPYRYFRIFSLDELPKGAYYIVRRSSRSLKETFDRFGYLSAESLLGVNADTDSPRIKQVPGLSLNLLGGRFVVPHLRFRPVRLAMEDWDPTKPEVRFSDIKSDIETIEPEPIPIFFLLKSIHRKSFPYIRTFDKDYKKKKIPPEFLSISGSREVDAQTLILHRPNNCNFWHVEFHIRDKLTGELLSPKQVSDSNPQKQGSKLVRSAFENILMISGLRQTQTPAQIPCVVYIKPAQELARLCRTIKLRITRSVARKTRQIKRALKRTPSN